MENTESQAALEEKGEETLTSPSVKTVVLLGADGTLANRRVRDYELPTFRTFKSLILDDEPIVSIPEQYLLPNEYDYRMGMGRQCHLCGSPYRELAERVYLDGGKNAQAVVIFFAKHFGARILWQSVKNHMETHCDMTSVRIRGLTRLANAEQEYSDFLYRETDMAILGMIAQIDRLESMDCSKNPEREIRRSNALRPLYLNLQELKEKRDSAGTTMKNLFEVLTDLYNAMPSVEAKRIVFDKMKAFQQQYRESGPI